MAEQDRTLVLKFLAKVLIFPVMQRRCCSARGSATTASAILVIVVVGILLPGYKHTTGFSKFIRIKYMTIECINSYQIIERSYLSEREAESPGLMFKC